MAWQYILDRYIQNKKPDTNTAVPFWIHAKLFLLEEKPYYLATSDIYFQKNVLKCLKFLSDGIILGKNGVKLHTIFRFPENI